MQTLRPERQTSPRSRTDFAFVGPEQVFAAGPKPSLAVGPELAVAACIGLAGFLLGALTAYGQGSLPHGIAPLANSAGPWSLAAFALALLARRWWTAVPFGVLTLGMLLAGYVVADQLRGYPSATSTTAFWGLAVVVVGPVLGLAGHWVRFRSANFAGVGAGVISGVLVGEAIRGLTVLDPAAEHGTPGYWIAELTVGILLLLGLCASRFRAVLPFVLGVLAGVVLTAAFLSLTLLHLLMYVN